MTVLRLEPLQGSGIDAAIAAVEAATLTRRADGSYVEVPIADVPAIVRALAFAGVHASPCDADLAVPTALLPAVGHDLTPVSGPLIAVDVLRVRRVSLGQATREVLRRRFAWLRSPSAAARKRCRALLRGDDAVLAWDRRAWATRSALRDRRARMTLRPVVFDRSVLDGGELLGRTFASEGALARWMFA